MTLEQEKKAANALYGHAGGISEKTSLQLSLLKVISCIAVIYVHSYTPQYEFFAAAMNKMPLFHYTSEIISKFIAQTAVPVFFLVSGIIYFSRQYQCGVFEFAVRKFRSVLLPYLLWNSIAIAYISIAQLPDKVRQIFPPDKVIANFSAGDWLNAYIGWGNNWFPFLYPLWFLPCLFAVFMIVHIFRKYFYRWNWPIWLLTGVNIIGFAYIPLYRQIDSCGPWLRLVYSLAFFTLGKLFWEHKKLSGNLLVLPVSGVVFSAAVILSFCNPCPDIKWLIFALYAGMFFILCLSGWIVEKCRRLNKYIVFLAGFSFVVYLTHEFALTALFTLIYPLLPMRTGVFITVYLLLPLLLASGLITGGWLLKKLLPKVYAFLFSNR